MDPRGCPPGELGQHCTERVLVRGRGGDALCSDQGFEQHQPASEDHPGAFGAGSIGEVAPALAERAQVQGVDPRATLTPPSPCGLTRTFFMMTRPEWQTSSHKLLAFALTVPKGGV